MHDHCVHHSLLDTCFFTPDTRAESCGRFWRLYHKSQSFFMAALLTIWTPLGGTRRWSCWQCCKTSSLCQSWRHMLMNNMAEGCLSVTSAHVLEHAHAATLRLPDVQPVLLLRMMMEMMMHNSHCCLGMPGPHLTNRAHRFMTYSAFNWASRKPCCP